MKFNIVLNGVSVSREIPTGYHMVTFRKWLELAKAGSDIPKVISVITDIDADLVAKANIKNFDVLMSCLVFLQKPCNEIMPSKILGIDVPKNIEDEAAARFADVQEIVNKFTQDDRIANLSYYPSIVATYVLPSPYDWKQSEQLALRLWDAPCSEVLAIGNFTLLKYNASRNGMLNSSHLEGTLRNRLKRGLINWLNRLAFSIRYATWRRSLPSHVKNSLNGR